ncbi:MAG: HAD family hydrolase [Thermococcus sp.]|nr:HAD family hydrolase [Thermococcus sp.]
MLVIVDLDDTLCTTWEAGKKVLLRLFLELLRERKFRLIKYILFGGYKELYRVESLHKMELEDILREVFFRVYGKEPGDGFSRTLKIVEEVFFSNLRLYPDAVPFLEGLKSLGAKIVLVTDSSSRWQRRKIERLGLGGYFDSVIISGETGHSKLTPHNFRLALSLFPDREVYVVGDRDETDMAGAKAIRAVGILVKRGHFRGLAVKNADYVVNDLIEALEVIKREHGLKNRAEA